MSKFYGKSSDDSSSSDSEVETRQPARKSAFNKMAAFSSDESSSDESVARAKPMKKDVFMDILRSVRSHIKNNDYPGLAVDYTDALKGFEKTQNVSGEIPKAFIRVLYELNSFISELQASGATKKMSQVKAQSVNKLKAQMNKGNKAFETELAKCVENPSEYDVLNEGEEAAEEESDNESEESSESADSDSDSDSSSDSDDSSSDSDTSSSDSDISSGSSTSSSSSSSSDWDESEESSDEEEDEMARRERRMRRWLKDSDEESDYETSAAKKAVVARVRKPQKTAPVVVVAGGEEEEDTNDVAVDSLSGGPRPSELPEKELIEKARDLLSGKTKLNDARDTLNVLDECISAAANQWGPICELTLSVSTVSFVLDASSGLAKNGSVPDDLWFGLLDRISRIIGTMRKSNTFYPVSIHELVPEMKPEEEEESGKRKRIAGNGMVALTAELVDEEFMKSFQSIDLSESPSVYAKKLGMLPNLISMLLEMRSYLVSETHHHQTARISARLLSHMHYQSGKSLEILSARLPALASPNLVDQLTDSIFAFGSKKEKAGAILISAYIAASRGDIVKAKRLISADLFDLVAVSEVSLQIQYNRALAMVGIAAFHAGDVKDCYNLLTDMCSTGRLRELLAQGINRQINPAVEKSAESERAEKRRLLPLFMHMNVELIEAAYSISAMILEVPHLAKSLLPGQEMSTRRLAKYRRQLESYDRQLFSGPPESAKDAVALAGKAILNDDVEKAVELIESMRVWGDAAAVKSKTILLVRQAALITYLINNSVAASHNNFNLDVLSATFKLAKNVVTCNICRSVMNGDLSGKICKNFFVPSVTLVSKMHVHTQALREQVHKLETVYSEPSTVVLEDENSRHVVIASILAQLNPPPPLPGQVEREIGARRIRRVGLASAKALAATQQAAERKLQAGLAKRRGWDNARGQPLQGQVISTEKKKVFGKSYGY